MRWRRVGGEWGGGGCCGCVFVFECLKVYDYFTSVGEREGLPSGLGSKNVGLKGSNRCWY